MKKLGWVVLAGALGALAIPFACKSPAAPGGILLTGTWGSEQGRFTGTQSSVQWQGACGFGHANVPIMQDKKGRFDIEGTYAPVDGSPSAANFKGKVSSGQLQLSVEVANPESTIGPMMLELNTQTVVASSCQ